MKRYGLILSIVFCASIANATHRFGTNASNITSGTLDPARVNPSTFTMGGAQVMADILNLHGSTSTLQSQINSVSGGKTATVTISTGGNVLADYTGNTRTAFVNALAVVGGGGDIFVKRGTYTLEILTVDGPRIVCEDGAIFRRANNNQMFRLRNASIDNCTFITTAVVGTAITTSAIAMDSNSKLLNVKFELAQDNRQASVFADAPGFIESSGAVNVLIDGITVSSYTNLYNNSASRNGFIGVTNSTGVTISNSFFNADFTGTQSLDGTIRFRNSDIRITHNSMNNASNSSASIYGTDVIGFKPSKYFISSNRMKDSGAGRIIVEATYSSGSAIVNNQFIAESNNTVGIHIRSGGYGVASAAQSALLIGGNTMQSGDDALKSSSIFVEIADDSAKDINGIALVGNNITKINTFASESGTVIKTSFRSNYKDGVIVADQN